MDINTYLTDQGFADIEVEFVRNERKRTGKTRPGQYDIYKLHICLTWDIFSASGHGRTVEEAADKVLDRLLARIVEAIADDGPVVEWVKMRDRLEAAGHFTHDW